MSQSLEEYFTVSVFLTLTCLFALLFYIVTYVKKLKKLPPGPIGLPIVGYLPFLTKKPPLKLAKLASKYGNIFSMRLGNNLYLVLNNAKVIREAFSKPEFLGRPPDNLFALMKNFESPFFSSGKTWQEQRRFAMHALRNLGFGKSWMEKHIVEEIQYFLDGITRSNGTPIRITEMLTASISNNICSLVFGHRYKYDDPKRIFLDNSLELISGFIEQLGTYIFFPWMKKFPFSNNIFQTGPTTKRLEKLRTFMRQHVDEHQKTLDPENVRDYIDRYLIELKTRLEADPQTVFSRSMLTGSLMNLFAAGTETLRTSLGWCLYIMTAFQDVQEKVQTEIDEVIGKERMPSWQDQKEMPFTQSVLAEVQRWKTVAPVSVTRYTLEDTELQGYFIPKGTSVTPNIWFAHHDPEEWECPEEFRPNRFLSKDGKSFIKPQSYLPFSTGKRSCPGEILALIEMFLYFTSILQKFRVEMPEGILPDLEGNFRLTYQPKPQLLCFRHRS